MSKKVKEQEVQVKENKSQEKEQGKVSNFQKLRGSRKFRLWFIGILVVIAAVLFFFFEKLRIVLAVAIIALLAAFGFEAAQSDWDLGKLWETKSFEQSKVSRDESGNILFDKMGNITTDSSRGKTADEYNCDDFTTKGEAQIFFEKVGGAGNDINRLDGDKDGEACESLPKGN